MNQEKPVVCKHLNGRPFYKWPYLDIGIALEPIDAIRDLWRLWNVLITCTESAAAMLTRLIDQGIKTGIFLILYVEHVEATLPEEHRLTSAVLSLKMEDSIFIGLPSQVVYRTQQLNRLFGV